MRRRILSLVVIILLGLLGFLSFKLVSSIADKAVNVRVSSILRSGINGNSDSTLDEEKSMGISKEDEEFLTDNLGDELVLAVDSLVKNSNRNFTKLEFSSFNDFIVSYNDLVCNLVGDIKVESHYYSDLRCTMSVYSINNIEVVSFADGSLYKVTITGSCENIKGFVDEEEFEIKENDRGVVITYSGY